MFSKNVFILFFFIIKLSQSSPLIVPLYSTKNIINSYSVLDILDFFKNNRKYSYIEIGQPSQRFQIIFISTDSNNIIKGETPYSDSFYNLNISKTKQFDYEPNELNYFYLKDLISFDTYYKNLLMPFIYYNSTINQEKNYGIVGLAYPMKSEEENNLILQLKKLKAINKAIFYFNYTKDNQVFLNIGSEPYEIDDSYTKNPIIMKIDPILDYEVKTGKIRKYNWNLNISRIFYFRKLPFQTEIDPYVEISRMKTRKINFFQALLVPEDDLIKGPFEYMEAIEENFFDDLISDNICTKISFENKYYYFCKKEYKGLIKNTFPTIYFYQPDINYMFELTYDDLFFEKDNYLFFGIYFDKFQIEVFMGAFISEWTFGKIFLKKYCFAFDLENKKLYFYKKNKIEKTKNKTEDKKNENENKNSNKKIYQLGLILVVITIGVFAFLIDRFARKRYRVNNLLIDFENPQV